MSFIYPLLIVVHVILCLFLILLVLVQNDKGGGLAGALGGMGGGAAFSGSSAASFITKLTQMVAISSFVVILAINGLASKTQTQSTSELAQPRSSDLGVIIPSAGAGALENTTVVPGIEQAAPAAAQENNASPIPAAPKASEGAEASESVVPGIPAN